MESLIFVGYLFGVVLCMINTNRVGAIEPTCLSKPENPIVGFEGETVRFTWTFSNASLIEHIFFAPLSTRHNTLDTFLISVFQNETGSIAFFTNKDQVKYYGRVKWVGNVSEGVASYELSNIKQSDNKPYAVEITFRNDDETELQLSTKLVVKKPSTFTSFPGQVTQKRGESASFAWSYSLSEEDKIRLSSITFGVYNKQDGKYEALCVVKVNQMLVAKSNCSTAVRKANTNFTVIDPTRTAAFSLSKILFEDEAVYSIRLGGTLRNMENKTNLVVTDPPSFLEQPKSTTVIEGRNLTLTCMAVGKPHPTITWIKDGQVLKTNSSELYSVPNIAREDVGKYKCVARNKVGNMSSSEVYVDVQYAPTINISSKVNILPLPIGKGEWLNCVTIANPTARIQWFSNGMPKKDTKDKLYVLISNPYDYVNYTCKAKNLVGEDNVTFVLRQVGPPSNPQVDCEQNLMTRQSQTTIFHWFPPKNDGGSPILKYTVKSRSFAKPSEQKLQEWININVSRTKTWHKFPLEWQKFVEFTITAWNIYGESKLDPDNTCLVSVGKDPKIKAADYKPTSQPTPRIVAAAAKKNEKGDNPMTKIWLYGGICVGAFGIVMLVLSIIWYRKRKNSRKGNWYNHHASFNALTMEGNMLEGTSVNSHLLQSDPQFRARKQSMVGSPRYQMDPEWTIPREKICILKVIGNGAFGLVYKGRVHGVGPNTLGWNLVAIKSPYADASDAEVKDLMKEFELLKTLKPHPHVIKLLGCGEDEGRPLVITEYVPFGDLLGYLRKSRGENDDYFSDPEIKPSTNLSSQQLLRFGWHVADGMAYLASEKILHRDLAARNVLVGEGLSCKVTDFGMAKDVSNDEIYIRSTEGRLPVKWTAIEALTGGGEYTTKSDVWSFGVVLYEICTIGAEPFPGVAAKEIPQHIESGYRMKRPGHVDPELYDVMMTCWETEPDERPTFPELKETLMKLEEVQSRDYINLTECLYQNINVRGTGPGSLRHGEKSGTLKGSVKGNAYHIGPGVQGHVTAV